MAAWADRRPSIAQRVRGVFTAGSLALALRDAIEQRDAAIRQAHAAGASVAEIAATTGLIEQEVTTSQLVRVVER